MKSAPITLRTVAGGARLPAVLADMERTAYGAATVALRRVGTESWQYGRLSGQRIDARTLAARAALPEARVFGRRDEGRDETPDASLLLVVDASGSMWCGRGEPTAARALAVAHGIARAAERVGVPVTLATHDERGGRVSVSGWARISDALGPSADAAPMRRAHGAGNYDAPAVLHAWRSFAPLAKRRAAVLVCDGLPAMDGHIHHAAACLAEIRRDGGAFAFAAVSHSPQSARDLAHSASGDWGAHRCASAFAAAAFAGVIVRAISEVRTA